MNILLTSVGRRSYLVEYFKAAMTRAVGSHSRVYVANSEVSPAWKAADQGIVTPLIYDENYIPFLLETCRKYQIDLLLSLFDADLPVLAKYKGLFAMAGTTVVVSDPEVIQICNDKWATMEFLKKLELPVPATFLSLPESLAALREGCISWPVMVKPRWGMGSLAIYEAENEEELKILYQKSRRQIARGYLQYEARQDVESCVLIQEKLTGQEYGLDVINDLNGNYQTTIVKKKLAMRSGETDMAETVDYPALKMLGEILGRNLGHLGNLDADVFDVDGKRYVLEMNARFGGGYPFSHLAGVDLPEAIIRWKLGNPLDSALLVPRIGVTGYKDLVPKAFVQKG